MDCTAVMLTVLPGHVKRSKHFLFYLIIYSSWNFTSSPDAVAHQR